MADLTTVEAVKAYAGVKGSEDDGHVAGFVSGVSAMIASHVGHDYEGQSVVAESHVAPFSGAIVLQKPAATIGAVRVGGTTLAPAGYRLRGGRLLVRLSSGVMVAWSSGVPIEIDYTTDDQVPADLELAAREIAAFVVKQSGVGGGGSRLGLSAQANSDTGSADYFAQALMQLPVARMALRNHKRLL